jgi:aminobenzoyl-glutamate utilization protein B
VIINEAKKELDERVGKDFEYKALLGDRKPPLNYRVN